MKKSSLLMAIFVLALLTVPSYITFGNASQERKLVPVNSGKYADLVPVLVITESRNALDDVQALLGAHLIKAGEGQRVGELVKKWMIVKPEGLAILENLKSSGRIVNYLVKPKPAIPDIKKLFDVEGNLPEPPEPMLFDVIDLVRSAKVNDELGFSGAGIRIAIVDTGVDYSNPDLWDALDYVTWTDGGVGYREPLVLDADETQVVMFTPIHDVDSDGWSDETEMMTITLIPFQVVEEYNAPVYLDGIPSASGEYRFGIIDEGDIGIRLPILLADPDAPGNYTLAIIDWDNDGNFTDQFIDEGNFYTYDGNRITYWDNPAGIPGDFDSSDLSVGVLGGFFYDWWWNFDWISRFYPGWDLNGEYMSIFYDFYGHGTECAASAASRGVWSGLQGVAPEAKIVGIKGLAYGMVEPGWLWAAGFDVDEFGTYYYTGERRAQIISNSFGISIPYDYFGFGYDFESIMANALTVPGYLDPDFPGVIIVFAAGNGGFGYGTVTTGGSASGVITVGASTSLDSTAWIYALMGLPGYWALSGGNDEVISWSARGPSPLGEVKPDVLNVGAWAWVPAPFYYDGIDIFGGTSMATPLTAGVLALMVEAAGGAELTPYEYKAILESTAVDLGYNPFVQGAGRVDAYNSTLAILAITQGQMADTPIVAFANTRTGEEISDRIDMAWLWNWEFNIPMYFAGWFTNFFEVDPNIPENFFDTSSNLFLGMVRAGKRVNFQFEVTNLHNEDMNIASIEAVDYELISSQTLNPVIPGGSQFTYLTFDREWFAGADLTRFFIAVPYRYFDTDMDYSYESRFRMWIFAWNDSDGTPGPSDWDDFILLNYVYPRGTTLEATVGNIYDDVPPGWDVAVLLQTTGTLDVPVNFGVFNYRRVQDTAFSFRASDTHLASGESATISATLRTSRRASPGPYERQIIVRLTDGTHAVEKVLPISYNIYTTLRRGQGLTPPSSDEGTLYDLGGLRGAFDWSWRYESGDWRVYFVEVRSSRISSLFVDFRWALDNSSLIIYTLGPDGQYAGVYSGSGISYSNYIGDGIFGIAYVSRDGTYQRRMVSIPDVVYFDNQYPFKPDRENRIFTIMVHQVSHGGTALTDEINGEVVPMMFLRKFRDILRARADTLYRISESIRMARLPDLWVEPYVAPGAGNFSVYILMSQIPTATGENTLDATVDEWETTKVYRPGRPISTRDARSHFIIPPDPAIYLGGVEYIVSLPNLQPWYLEEGNPVMIWEPYYMFQDWTFILAH